MHLSKSLPHRKPAAGFTLPAILVVVGALLILAVGILLVAGIERNTARSFGDRERAELAAHAGLEEVRAMVNLEAANDDFLVIQSRLPEPIVNGCQPAPHLFIARGRNTGGKLAYRYVPLFSRPSNADPVGETSALAAPSIKSPAASEAGKYIRFSTLPYQDKVQLAWIPIKDSQDRTVARYAFWVEDLQGKLDPKLAGNADGTTQNHAREPYPFPAPGVDDPATGAKDPAALHQVALYAIDPAATEADQSQLGKTLIANRKLLLSPDSILAAAGIAPPLARLDIETKDGKIGQLIDLKARAAEENLATGVMPYQERPTIPFAEGIDPSVAGNPKLNLNTLLGKPRATAIGDFANLVGKALPEFNKRNTPTIGTTFPENYIETLAANAFDYADVGGDASVVAGRYRGIDSYPLLSESYLQVNYLGRIFENGRRILPWKIIVSAELWNMTNKRVKGKARVSYEVDLHPTTGFGASSEALPFDSPELLDDKVQNPNDLVKESERYWTREVDVELGPNQYKFYQFAVVDYKIDAGGEFSSIPGTFELTENEGSRGMSLQWNTITVDRAEKLKRIDSPGGTPQFFYQLSKKATDSKAAIHGHGYKMGNTYWNNMGDPRIAYYLRAIPLADNASPENLSPNRRNFRDSIYKPNTEDLNFYGRVLPSEWPDGGHDSPVGSWVVTKSETVVPTDNRYAWDSTDEKSAPQRISNNGCFFSATELGNVYDPLLRRYALPGGIAAKSLPSDKPFFPDVIASGSECDPNFGGGNTLRIGRREHPLFDRPGWRAAHLLDLFHAGDSTTGKAAEREGPLVTIAGNVNLNTAGRGALRALAAGVLMQDAAIGYVDNSHIHLAAPYMSPGVKSLYGTIGTPTDKVAADRIADAIIASRPISSAAELSAASLSPRKSPDLTNPDPNQVFGNRQMYSYSNNPDDLQWSDAAAEETFARVYGASTVRSRNFRIWVVGQAVAPLATSSTANPGVLAEVRRVFTVFADPGVRNSDSEIDPTKSKLRVTYENDF